MSNNHDNRQAPILAIKQALCFSCWSPSPNLNRCGACKRVSYCSTECQKKDWRKNHKDMCKVLVTLNKHKGPVPLAERTWENFNLEKIQDHFRIATIDVSETGRLIIYEPYCCHCYRRVSQLEASTKLKACQACLLASFCTSCAQSHPAKECHTFQDIVQDEKFVMDLRRRTGKDVTVLSTAAPRREYLPLSVAKGWFDYYTRVSDKSKFDTRMNLNLKSLSGEHDEGQLIQSMRCSSNVMSIPLTIIAALEATMPALSTCPSISLHLIGVTFRELEALQTFEEVLHLLPSLKKLQLSLIGFEVPGTQELQPLHLCSSCSSRGRTVSLRLWQGPYHDYISTTTYKKPDLVAAFHPGFSQDSQADWFPTIKYLAHAPHPTVFTSFSEYEMNEDISILEKLGARFALRGEVNKWKGVSPKLETIGTKANGVYYLNYYWYIVSQK